MRKTAEILSHPATKPHRIRLRSRSPFLSIRPGLTHDEAIRTAAEHLNTVISALDALPDQTKARDQSVLEGARVNVRIGKALLKIAQARSTISVPIT